MCCFSIVHLIKLLFGIILKYYFGLMLSSQDLWFFNVPCLTGQ